MIERVMPLITKASYARLARLDRRIFLFGGGLGGLSWQGELEISIASWSSQNCIWCNLMVEAGWPIGPEHVDSEVKPGDRRR
jgi:hypothetical protein